ncbi:MAG: 8-amino-7-oxononanoate synthase [Gammaproteobacteria bacterium]|nr:8-amino-7-oxononanoate synthase [Gammaproteobacteria bacterium]
MPRSTDIASRLAELRGRNLYRQRRVIDGPQGREVEVDGRRLLNFCSNDYLGLAADPRVVEALANGARHWGVGAGASHLVCGHTRAHHELEEALARFTGRPRALVFSSGYAANLGAIGALLGPGDRVLEDRLNHASLLDGGWLSRARFGRYRHGDLDHLAVKLADGPGEGRTLVVSDGTFSMDGDRCALRPLVDVARAHAALVMIDDAHGIGVHGEDGCGLVDPRAFTTQDVAVLVGTFGKALGTAGAFVAGEADLVDLMIQQARTYIYTTAMPPALAVATLASLHLAATESWRREALMARVAQFRAGAAALGLALAPSPSPIQPLIVGESERALALSAALAERGVWVSAIRPPTVPPGTARLRVTLSAAHEGADVDRLLEALAGAHRVVGGG